ncbi:MAG TPA: hypothetical protein VHN78_03570 [Chloroflexota bacterium]|nr:hypothetical protein [Chloroflexota bacterium]
MTASDPPLLMPEEQTELLAVLERAVARRTAALSERCRQLEDAARLARFLVMMYGGDDSGVTRCLDLLNRLLDPPPLQPDEEPPLPAAGIWHEEADPALREQRQLAPRGSLDGEERS